MRRDTNSFLIDVADAAYSILDAVNGISLDDYCSSRLIRSSVEREFIITGEALTNLSVWDVIQSYLMPLRAACIALAADSGPGAL
jgi:uncharacterized protein with HEPN domain